MNTFGGVSWPLVCFVSLMLLVVSAMAVALSVHQSRQGVDAVQIVQRERDALQLSWSQLLLEKNTLGGFSKVERKAESVLGMHLPVLDDIRVVQP